MKNPRILSIQDISCFGKCSLTVALPILSACGIETAVIPTAVLSTHTGGFSGYTFRDLTQDMPDIAAHWKKEKIYFDAVYTGYLGSAKQSEYVKNIFKDLIYPGGLRIVDPVMADHGKLYKGFDRNFVKVMADLCRSADIILPNITEAAFLTGIEYVEGIQKKDYPERIFEKLADFGVSTIVLKGIVFDNAKIGVGVHDCKKGETEYYFQNRFENGRHGTGDCFASAFCGALLNGKSRYEAAEIAAQFVLECLQETGEDRAHWYGVRFEKTLPKLIKNFQSPLP